MSLFSKIRGTIESIFSIGLGGPQLKKSSGNALDVRDSVDGAFAQVRVGAPAGANDATTKTYADAILTTAEAYTDAAVAGVSVAGVVREIRFVTGTGAAQPSATLIPANAVVMSAQLKITTPYSALATLSVGQVGSVALLQATVDNLPQSTDMFEVNQDTPWGATPLAVLVTVGGAPVAGAGVCIVRYTVPNP